MAADNELEDILAEAGWGAEPPQALALAWDRYQKAWAAYDEVCKAFPQDPEASVPAKFLWDAMFRSRELARTESNYLMRLVYESGKRVHAKGR